jgi:hypothetical protein
MMLEGSGSRGRKSPKSLTSLEILIVHLRNFAPESSLNDARAMRSDACRLVPATGSKRLMRPPKRSGNELSRIDADQQ